MNKLQEVYNQPRYALKESYVTKRGQKKNRYELVANARVIKGIKHMMHNTSY